LRNAWFAGIFGGSVERPETVQQCASRLLTEDLKRRGWDQGELRRRKKSDQTKEEIAQQLRRETTVTWDRIARGLAMRASGYAANYVRSFLSGA
jgi:hypothetical protein